MKRHILLTSLAVAVMAGTSLFVLGQTTTTRRSGDASLRFDWSDKTAPSVVDVAVDGQVLSVPMIAAMPHARHDNKATKITAEYARTSDSAERAKLAEDLTAVVSEQFDQRQQSRAKELDELEQQLERLREIHERREQERRRIVSDRVQQLLREADGLGWGTSDPRSLRSSVHFAPGGYKAYSNAKPKR